MAKDLGDVIGTAVGRVARDAVQTVSANARKASNGPLSGMKGVAAGAGLAALAPLAARQAGKLAKRAGGGGAGLAKDARKALLPSGGGDGKATGLPGVGKGRRMPVQQAVDVAVPVTTAYNQWTQFEDWPRFMHRLERVSQEDESHVTFRTKIWGISKEFKAEIVDQRPDERIKWRVTEGVSHTGVVTFHALADRLTRIEVNIDVHPGSLLEKAGRGMRHVKRAVRADLSRFKAYIEMEEEETGAWRGVIDEGKVKRSRSSSPSSSRAKATSSGGRSRSSSSGGRSRSSSSGGRSRSSSSSSRSRGRSSSGGSKGSGSGKASSGGGSGSGSSSRKSSSS
jgi:uncharacterized membrane protein